jgi:hypothetical protein
MCLAAIAEKYNTGNFQQQEAEEGKIALYENENILQSEIRSANTV